MKMASPHGAPIVYEFLPVFCYNCGIIGHANKSCVAEIAEGGSVAVHEEAEVFA